MKKTQEQLADEQKNIEWDLANELAPITSIDFSGEIIHTPAPDNTPEIKRLRRVSAQISNEILAISRNVVAVVHMAPRAPRARRHTEGSRSSAASGDGNSDPDPDPERRLQPLQLLDQAVLADLLHISKKTLQNLYSNTPHLLPQAISIPGARGPRWTIQAVQTWLDSRPAHHNTAKTAPKAAKRKVGRPRIALATTAAMRGMVGAA